MSDDALILRTVEETEPLNNKRGVTYRVQVVGGGGGGSALPDQTGHSGEFLTTDGTDASWATISALQNTATGTDSLTILGDAATNAYSINIGVGSRAIAGNAGIAIGNGSNSWAGGISIGYNTYATKTQSLAIGQNASARGDYSLCLNGSSANSWNAIAIGFGAQANATGAIQVCTTINGATNSDANTFKVANANGNFEMMSADGTIPTARLTKVNSTITLTAAGWSGGSQTVTVSGITATGVVLVSPDPTDQSAYTSAGIICTAQAAGTLTFTCSTTPSADIDVNVVML